MKYLKTFNENFITDLFKKSDEDKIADQILKKIETSEVRWESNLSGLGSKEAHYLSDIVFKDVPVQVTTYNDFYPDGGAVYKVYVDGDLLECSESKSRKIYNSMFKRYKYLKKEKRLSGIKSKIVTGD